MAPENPESSSPRKRRRTPTPSSPSSTPHGSYEDSDSDHETSKRRRTNLSVEVCKDFIRNVCRRSPIDCKFAHPHSTVTIDDNDKVMACADSLRNKCFRGRTCRYYHPPPHIQESLLKAIGVQDAKVETVCRDFMRGRCLRAAKECRYAHHSSVDHCAIICQDFIRGRCERKSCRYSHVLVREISEVCQDFIRGRCERKSCRYSHVLVSEISQVHLQQYRTPMELPSSPPRTGNDQEILQVCRDFLKKMCKRDSCEYAHPDSKTKVIDNQVEVCRDFRRGICHRTVCRFYHPSAVNVAKQSRLDFRSDA